MNSTDHRMNLFKTAGAIYLNLDQATRFLCKGDCITIHFEGETQITLRNDDAKKLGQVLAQLGDEFEGRVLKPGV